jgi:hypothetical protein
VKTEDLEVFEALSVGGSHRTKKKEKVGDVFIQVVPDVGYPSFHKDNLQIYILHLKVVPDACFHLHFVGSLLIDSLIVLQLQLLVQRLRPKLPQQRRLLGFAFLYHLTDFF